MSSWNSGWDPKNFYPHRNECDYILFSNSKSLQKYAEEDHKFISKKPLIEFDYNLYKHIQNNLINKDLLITGFAIFTILLLMKTRVKFELNYIGFSSDHKLEQNKQSYYWGKRTIDKAGINGHLKHGFIYQKKIIKALDLIKKSEYNIL